MSYKTREFLSFLHLFIFILCLWVFCLYVGLCIMSVQCPWRRELNLVGRESQMVISCRVGTELKNKPFVRANVLDG